MPTTCPPPTDLLFDIRLDDPAMDDLPAIQPWRSITLDPDWRGPWLVAGDLTGDGRCSLVNAMAHDHNDVHHTVAITAYALDGTVLWQWGDPGCGGNALHSDFACQIHDWDDDGRNEVVLCTDTHLVVLDGASGQERERLPIPPHASDCVSFVRLDGPDRPTTPLVKDRYRNVWALWRDGSIRWHFRPPAGQRCAHQVVAVERDGRERPLLLAGFCAIDSDGALLWSLESSGIACDRGHLDCARTFRGDHPENDLRLVMTRCGGDGMVCVDIRGHLLWQHDSLHYESVDIGRLHPTLPGPQMSVDITHGKQPYTDPLLLLDATGRIWGRILGHRVRQHFHCDWLGNDLEQIVIPTGDRVLIDAAAGCPLARFATPQATDLVPLTQSAQRAGEHRRFGNYLHMGFSGNICGDGREDIVLHTNPGTTVWIYRNSTGATAPRSLGTAPNYTLY